MPTTLHLVLVELDCCVCGLLFGVPPNFARDRREDGASWWCPNGHNQYFTETESARLRRQLEAAQRQAQDARRSEEFWRERNAASQRSVSAYRGQLTKVRRRVGNGVCPCCKRTFKNLQDHMEGQHPDYKEPQP